MNVFLDAALNSSNRFEQKHSAFVITATEGDLCSCYRVVRFTGDRQEKEESNRQLAGMFAFRMGRKAQCGSGLSGRSLMFKPSNSGR